MFAGLPFISFGNQLAAPEEQPLQAVLKVEKTQPIEIKRSQKKKLAPPLSTDSNSSISSSASGTDAEGEGGGVSQKGQAFRLPSSATLFYDAVIDGQVNQTGRVDWIVNDGGYRLYINVPYAFVGPFVFESRGVVDKYGLAPAIYWTQRGEKSPRYSRFDRDEKGGGKMFFTEKPEFTPDILPGTQDRFSLMFQLASLLNGSDKIDEAGVVREIPVVDYNTLEMWQFLSFGEELKSDAIPTLGQTAVRHYRLIQRASDPYKRQVDIWLAKDLEWLPGRVRTLGANGRVFELVFKQRAN